jgi:hypothetical protein
LVSSVDRIALTRAIKELPVGYRTIFLLHEVEGYEHQEIAELLDCSVGNSKSQLHKAKLRIRELLGYAREEEVTVSTATRQQRTQQASRRRGAASPERWRKQPAEWDSERGSMIPALNTGTPTFLGSNA